MKPLLLHCFRPTFSVPQLPRPSPFCARSVLLPSDSSACPSPTVTPRAPSSSPWRRLWRFPPLCTCLVTPGPQRQFRMSRNTGILWTGSVISGLRGYTESPRTLGDRVVILGSFLLEHILWTKSYVYGEDRAFSCLPPQMESGDALTRSTQSTGAC